MITSCAFYSQRCSHLAVSHWPTTAEAQFKPSNSHPWFSKMTSPIGHSPPYQFNAVFSSPVSKQNKMKQKTLYYLFTGWNIPSGYLRPFLAAADQALTFFLHHSTTACCTRRIWTLWCLWALCPSTANAFFLPHVSRSPSPMNCHGPSGSGGTRPMAE